MGPVPCVDSIPKVIEVGGSPVKDVFLPLAMFLGLTYLISLMIFDAYVGIAGKPARIWIPGKSLVLSALMIQILSYLKVKPFKWSEDLPLDLSSKYIVQNQMVGESGRVVTCVLIGYLLPGMGRAGSATDWSTLAALVMSLVTSEYLYWKNLLSIPEKGYITSPGIKINPFYFTSLLAINMIVIVSIIMLILFSISAILAGRTIRSMLAEKISVIQWGKSKDIDQVGSWEKFEAEIKKSWFLARVCHPQYVIARSVLSSAAGLVVTICIIFMAIRQFYMYDYYSDTMSTDSAILIVGWILEWIFIVIGGAIIFCRWFTAVVYFPRSFVKNVKLGGHTRPFVEDYWTRGILELIEMYELQKWRLKKQSKVGIPSGRPLRLATTMKVHYLLYGLWTLQVSLICFSKGCFFISRLVFSYKYVRIFLPRIDRVPSRREEFQDCREILTKACMPGENPEHLWAANEKSMEQVEGHFEESIKKGSKCKDLIDFINETRFHVESNDDGRFVCQLESLPFVTEHFPALNENCITMTALSLSFVIIKISPLDKERLTEVCEQALDLMSFVDNSDPQCPTTIDMLKVIDIEADRVGLAIYNEFQSLLKLKSEKENPISLNKSPNLASPGAARGKALETIQEILEEAKKQLEEVKGHLEEEKQLNKKKSEITNKEEHSRVGEENVEVKIQVERSEHIVKGEYSMDWSALASHYSRYRVCKLILSREFNNVNELHEYLADVVVYCLLKLPKLMVKTCREWAVKFEEEKIWDAMYIAGKVMGIMKECHGQFEGKILEPKFVTMTSNEIKRGLLDESEDKDRERARMEEEVETDITFSSLDWEAQKMQEKMTEETHKVYEVAQAMQELE